jgi:hypothetical protein
VETPLNRDELLPFPLSTNNPKRNTKSVGNLSRTLTDISRRVRSSFGFQMKSGYPFSADKEAFDRPVTRVWPCARRVMRVGPRIGGAAPGRRRDANTPTSVVVAVIVSNGRAVDCAPEASICIPTRSWPLGIRCDVLFLAPGGRSSPFRTVGDVRDPRASVGLPCGRLGSPGQVEHLFDREPRAGLRGLCYLLG